METDGFTVHHSLVSVWGVFPGLALKNTWANLRLQTSGASANALINIRLECCCGTGATVAVCGSVVGE